MVWLVDVSNNLSEETCYMKVTNQKVKISVAIITYNQQDTIAQTLDSILCQKGDFNLEVIVGEDCSEDGTRLICSDYAKHYPDVIRLLANTQNLGIMANFSRVMHACTGDFVAICAGDDYWCDEYKLQKQLDYFHRHEDIDVVSTAGYKLLVKRNQFVANAIAPINPIFDGDIKQFYFSKNYKGGVYAMPLSLLVRRDVLQYVDFDEFIRRDFPVEDYPMQAILAQYCRWGHIPDLCVVYRVYKESATFISFEHPKYLQYHRGLANIRRYLNELFPDDICFTEEELQEYEFYKEFLSYLYKGDYLSAKQLVYNSNLKTSKLNKTRKIVANRIIFTLFRLYKIIVVKIELKQRI